MSDFVAYHNTEKMGYEFEPTRRFHFFSRKPEVFLRKALRNRVWTVTGSRAHSGRMLYRLAGVFTALNVRPESDGFSIKGDGMPFRPPIDITAESWFSELLREQNKFSFGFNRIRGENIVKGFELLGDQRATPADSGIALSEGSKSSVSVTVYERNPIARQECLQHYLASHVVSPSKRHLVSVSLATSMSIILSPSPLEAANTLLTRSEIYAQFARIAMLSFTRRTHL